MNFASRLAAVTLAAMMCWTVPASAQQAPPSEYQPPRAPDPNHYAPEELVGAGHRFFGNVSRGLASVIERAVSQWGLPNGYILGDERDLSALRRHRRLGLHRRRIRHDRADRQQYRAGSDPLRHRPAARRQHR